nr:hypothetical protein [Tanacetum cinerariifolium]
KRVVIGISQPLNRVVTGATVIITTVMDQTGEVPSSPGVPLRAILTQFALLVDVDTQESVVELLKWSTKSAPVLDDDGGAWFWWHHHRRRELAPTSWTTSVTVVVDRHRRRALPRRANIIAT